MFWTVLTYLLIGLLSLFGLFYLWLEVRFYRALGTVREGRSDVNPPPRVSVLIAARNESIGIRATLDSVLDQDYAGVWTCGWPTTAPTTIPPRFWPNMPKSTPKGSTF